MPKLAISATNDEFFFMDDYWYYWDQMLGTKYLWSVIISGDNNFNPLTAGAVNIRCLYVILAHHISAFKPGKDKK